MNKQQLLDDLYKKTCRCASCELYKTRIKYVFGEGNPNTDCMLIGEASGDQENQSGRPFVGECGILLRTHIRRLLQIKLSSLYITNVVKCRPTVNLAGSRNRPPTSQEISACNHILLEQIKIIQPKLIITLGNVPTKFILNTSRGITRIHGKLFWYETIKVLPIYHPSYIIRNKWDKQLKLEFAEDIKKILFFLD